MGIGLLAARELLPFHLRAWQANFLIGAVPALLCVFIFKKLKEPEKWSSRQGGG